MTSTAKTETLADARAALNAGRNFVSALWGIWHLLDGGSAHAMTRSKLGRAEKARWSDPVATFEIERHGGSTGEVQIWQANLLLGTAERVRERKLPPETPVVRALPRRRDVEAVAAELASLIRAGGDDPRLRWEDDRRHEVKVLASSALGGATGQQAKQLRDAIAAELGDCWIRELGLFVKVKAG